MPSSVVGRAPDHRRARPTAGTARRPGRRREPGPRVEGPVLSAQESRLLALVAAGRTTAVQGALSTAPPTTSAAAWQHKPSWYAVSKKDRTIDPGLERFMAGRMHTHTTEVDAGHLSPVSHPADIARLILSAARSC
ncbi:alpha/beta fold hydrolase [Kitasatospora sp. NPDC058190]|uniref:alpha/beta fold hydrolase n=1 Tax=Kitasatospora sp. NPDC058190 TaxID=3346371 RepID=UPI0036DD56B0